MSSDREEPIDARAEAAGPGLDLSGHAGFPSTATTAAAVLEHLRSAVGFRFWAVTRVTGGTYAVVSTGRAGFPAAVGAQFPWADTLCRQALSGRAPRVAPDVRAVAAYQDLHLVQDWQIGAYLSAPLSLDGRSLHGTVCAVDPLPQPSTATAQVGLLDLQARLLSTVLSGELRLDHEHRRAERAEAQALKDPLTDLTNRRGWDQLLAREEQRCQRYGTLASVLVLDLDGLKGVNDQHGHGAGDALLRRTADVLRGAVRAADVVARLGGDEFAVLTVETDLPAARVERDRLSRLLHGAGVPVSVGAATREVEGGLAAAWKHADRDMYQAKHQRPRPSR